MTHIEALDFDSLTLARRGVLFAQGPPYTCAAADRRFSNRATRQ